MQTIILNTGDASQIRGILEYLKYQNMDFKQISDEELFRSWAG